MPEKFGGGPEKMGVPAQKAEAAPAIETAPSVASPEKISPRLLEGVFRLTKIAHALLPQDVPDVEMGNSLVPITREGVAYNMWGRQWEDTENSGEGFTIGHNIEKEIVTIGNKFEELGLTIRVDAYNANYFGKSFGKVKYTKAFFPWEVVYSEPKKLDLLFDAKTLRSSIRKNKSLSAEMRKTYLGYVDEIVGLYEQEKVELEKKDRENRRDCAEEIGNIEDLLNQYEKPDVLKALEDIKTEEEAFQNELRQKAVRDRFALGKMFKILEYETNISGEQLEALIARFDTLKRAIGAINGGVVDHTRS